MAKKHNSGSYTDEQIVEEIKRIRGQVDMMEHLLEMYEERYFNGQRNFSVTQQMHMQTAGTIVLPWRKRTVQKCYQIGKRTLERMRLLEPLKKTKVYQTLAAQGKIYSMATGKK